MPYRPVRKGIHESMGMWMGVCAAGVSSMDALQACAQGHP